MFIFRLPFVVFDAVWSFLGKLLLSPWGLILPATGLALLFLSTQLEKLSPGLAETYARQLIDCSDSEIGELVDSIVQLGDAGLPSLVRGLRSPRESVFFACRDALQRNLGRWAKQKEPNRSERYRQLTEILLREVGEFKPTALVATVEFVDQILRDTLKYRGASKNDSAMVSTNCEQLIEKIRSTRLRLLDPNDSSTAPTGDSIVRLHRSIVDRDLLAVAEPTDESEGVKEDPLTIDEFATPRAELLYAYHQSAAFRRQEQTPYRRPGMSSLPPGVAPEQTDSKNVEPQDEMLASMGPVRRTTGTDSFAVAEMQGKVANRFESESTSGTESELHVGNIAEDYVADGTKPRPTDRNGEPFEAESTSTREPNDFLSEELNRISPEKIPTLPTTKLMRLLQHADDRIVSAARKTLVGRDGFQESHLKLAFRLYHPLPTVRTELIGLLPNVGGIQQSVWLTELMNDPNDDVRFLAASALATASDPGLQRLLLDKGKRDTDPRIVELTERILEQRRKSKR